MSDPIASLHKMSPTAGAASQEYVAVNPVAVASVILGILSAFPLLLMVKVLLALPLAGVICGMIAVRQIRRSAGTQTGIGVAALGLILSLGIGGAALAMAGIDYHHEQQDGAAINAVLEDFGKSLHDAFPGTDAPQNTQSMPHAYQLFTDDFHASFPYDAFNARLQYFTHFMGRVHSVQWNNICHFTGDASDQRSQAQTMAIFTFERQEQGDDGKMHFTERHFGVYCKRANDGSWRIDGLPDLFVPPKQAAAANKGQ